MKDSTCISDEFAEEIKLLFFEHRPKRIIETGTYIGQGSTEIIASLIRDIPINGAEFHSIECGRINLERALKNLKASNLDRYVKLWWGLSIPSELIPTKEKTDLRLSELKGVYHDHPEGQEGHNYSMEISDFNRDNLLEIVIEDLSGPPEFILLDSAGHLGFIEFMHLISLLHDPCFIAIDDVDHVKHFETFSYASNSGRFEIIKRGRDRFGHAIMKFDPR